MNTRSRLLRRLKPLLVDAERLRGFLKRQDERLMRWKHRAATRFPQLIRPAPRQITIAITSACNLRCRGCRYGRDFMLGEHLDLQTVRECLDDAAAAGVATARFYGGEPLLHPDLPAMIRHAASLGMEPCMRRYPPGAAHDTWRVLTAEATMRMELTTQWSRIEQMQGQAVADAWQWFVERYREFVTVALRRLIWPASRAAEASEQFWGYLFASGAFERMQRPMHFRGFLMSTVRNYAMHWMRRNPRPAGECHTDPVTDPFPCLLEAEEMALWARQILHLALQRLDREQARWGWMLRMFYGVPAVANGERPEPRRATEIATELGCSANAMHQLLFRARRRLREYVVEELRQTVSTRQDLAAELALLVTELGDQSPGLVSKQPADGEMS